MYRYVVVRLLCLASSWMAFAGAPAHRQVRAERVPEDVGSLGQFALHLGAQFTQGHRFIDDLPLEASAREDDVK